MIYLLTFSPNTDCGYSVRRGSNEYPLSMLLSSKTKGSECPCKLHLSLYKVGFSSVPIAHTCLHDDTDF